MYSTFSITLGQIRIVETMILMYHNILYDKKVVIQVNLVNMFKNKKKKI